MQFLVGLNDEYKVIKGSILMMKPLPSIDQVYQLVIQEEKQRSLTASAQTSNTASAFHVGELVSSTDHSALAVQQHGFLGPQQRNASFIPTYPPGNPSNRGQSFFPG